MCLTFKRSNSSRRRNNNSNSTTVPVPTATHVSPSTTDSSAIPTTVTLLPTSKSRNESFDTGDYLHRHDTKPNATSSAAAASPIPVAEIAVPIPIAERVPDIVNSNHPDPPSNSFSLVVAATTTTDAVLDSGAGRHVHGRRSDFTNLSACPPQHLVGFTGAPVTVTHQGTVGNYTTDVLYLPTSNASVRSVGSILDSRGGRIIFEKDGATYETANASPVRIARRAESGLYLVIPGALPPTPPPNPAVNVCIVVPAQVRRESTT